MTVRDKFLAAQAELNRALVERADEVDLVMTGLVAGEHVLLVGPPGCGKSLLMASLSRFVGGTYFQILMTKFTTPEEVFGPLDLPALKEGRYRRVTANRFPEADLVYMSELFKSSSAVLNTTLMGLNERRFENDGAWRDIPLKLCLADSNEWPSEENGQKELGALFDRFVLRKEVKPVRSPAGRERLLYAPDSDLTPAFAGPLGAGELDSVRQEARQIPPGESFKEALGKCLDELRREGVSPGDRRLRKAFKVCQARAWLNGHPAVEPEDGEVLAHVLWDDPVEQPRKVADVVQKCMNPTGHSIARLLAEADEIADGADASDLTSATAAVKKLGDIAAELGKLAGTPRGKAALDRVKAKQKEIRLKTLEI